MTRWGVALPRAVELEKADRAEGRSDVEEYPSVHDHHSPAAPKLAKFPGADTAGLIPSAAGAPLMLQALHHPVVAGNLRFSERKVRSHGDAWCDRSDLRPLEALEPDRLKIGKGLIEFGQRRNEHDARVPSAREEDAVGIAP